MKLWKTQRHGCYLLHLSPPRFLTGKASVLRLVPSLNWLSSCFYRIVSNFSTIIIKVYRALWLIRVINCLFTIAGDGLHDFTKHTPRFSFEWSSNWELTSCRVGKPQTYHLHEFLWHRACFRWICSHFRNSTSIAYKVDGITNGMHPSSSAGHHNGCRKHYMHCSRSMPCLPSHTYEVEQACRVLVHVVSGILCLVYSQIMKLKCMTSSPSDSPCRLSWSRTTLVVIRRRPSQWQSHSSAWASVPHLVISLTLMRIYIPVLYWEYHRVWPRLLSISNLRWSLVVGHISWLWARPCYLFHDFELIPHKQDSEAPTYATGTVHILSAVFVRCASTDTLV